MVFPTREATRASSSQISQPRKHIVRVVSTPIPDARVEMFDDFHVTRQRHVSTLQYGKALYGAGREGRGAVVVVALCIPYTSHDSNLFPQTIYTKTDAQPTNTIRVRK